MKPEPDITEQIFPRFRAGTFIEVMRRLARLG